MVYLRAISFFVYQRDSKKRAPFIVCELQSDFTDSHVGPTGRKAASMNPRKKRVRRAPTKLWVIPVKTLRRARHCQSRSSQPRTNMCDLRDSSPDHHGSGDVPRWPRYLVHNHIGRHLHQDISLHFVYQSSSRAGKMRKLTT